MWGAMFLLAYVGGSALGRFVVSGVDPRQESAALAGLPPMPRDKRLEERDNPPVRTPEPILREYHSPSAHVCEGCDAGETRARQMAQQMGLPYYPPDQPVPDALDAEATDQRVPEIPLPDLP
jgi:hypothetical protein